MTLAVVGRSETSGTATSMLDRVFPTHQVGDLLIAIISTDGARFVTESPASGEWFVSSFTQGSGTSASTFGIAIRVATATNTTVGLAWSFSEAYVVHQWVIRGHDVVTPSTDVGMNETAGVSQSITFAAAPVQSSKASLTIGSICTTYPTVSYSPTVASTGFSELRSLQLGSSLAGASITSQERMEAAGISTVTPSSQTRSVSNSQWLSMTISIPEKPPAPDVQKIYIGDTQLPVDKIYIGNDLVNKIYVGDVLVYENAP